MLIRCRLLVPRPTIAGFLKWKMTSPTVLLSSSCPEGIEVSAWASLNKCWINDEDLPSASPILFRTTCAEIWNIVHLIHLIIALTASTHCQRAPLPPPLPLLATSQASASGHLRAIRPRATRSTWARYSGKAGPRSKEIGLVASHSMETSRS